MCGAPGGTRGRARGGGGRRGPEGTAGQSSRRGRWSRGAGRPGGAGPGGAPSGPPRRGGRSAPRAPNFVACDPGGGGGARDALRSGVPGAGAAWVHRPLSALTSRRWSRLARPGSRCSPWTCPPARGCPPGPSRTHVAAALRPRAPGQAPSRATRLAEVGGAATATRSSRSSSDRPGSWSAGPGRPSGYVTSPVVLASPFSLGLGFPFCNLVWELGGGVGGGGWAFLQLELRSAWEGEGRGRARAGTPPRRDSSARPASLPCQPRGDVGVTFPLGHQGLQSWKLCTWGGRVALPAPHSTMGKNCLSSAPQAVATHLGLEWLGPWVPQASVWLPRCLGGGRGHPAANGPARAWEGARTIVRGTMPVEVGDREGGGLQRKPFPRPSASESVWFLGSPAVPTESKYSSPRRPCGPGRGVARAPRVPCVSPV